MTAIQRPASVVGQVYSCDCGRLFTAKRTAHHWCSATCQSRFYARFVRTRKPIVLPELCCDICARRGKIVRFFLKQSIPKGPGRKATTRSVGTLFLCEQCWRMSAGRRRRLHGPRHVEAAA